METENLKEIKVENFYYQGIMFTIADDGDNCKIAWGNQLVTDRTFKKKEDAVKYIKSKPYDILLTLSLIHFTNYTKLQKS